MEKITQLFDIKTKIIAVLAIILIIFGVISYNKYNSSKKEKDALKTHDIVLIDSMKVEHFKILEDTIKKIMSKRADVIVKYKTIVARSEHEADSMISIYEANRTLQKADSALAYSVLYSDNQRKLIDEISKQLYDCSDLNTIKDCKYQEQEKISVILNKDNYNLRAENKKLKSRKLSFGVNAGFGANSNIMGGDIRLGWFAGVGISYKIF